jgi:hypothetical protein
VEHGVNGIILDEPSAACITTAIQDCIASPDRLEKLAAASQLDDRFALSALTQHLEEVAATL